MVDGRLDRSQSPSAFVRRPKKDGLPGQAIGGSRGGLTTKIHMLADAHGNPVDFVLTPGQSGDFPQGLTLLVGRKAEAVLADRAYDGALMREAAKAAGADPVIPAKRNRIAPEAHDAHLYKARHAIENGFAKLKHFRGLATRFEKTARNFAAAVAAACAIIWVRLL